MILTVTPNPALDLTYHLDRLTLGESHRVAAPTVRAGGKGVNVARVLASQGHETLVVAPVGEPGDRFVADLDRAALPHALVASPTRLRSTTALVTSTSTTNLNEAGEELPPATWAAVRELVESRIDEAAVLVVSGSMPASAPVSVISELVMAARHAGIPSIVDTSGPHLLAAADAGADLLKPNREELAAVLTGANPVAAASTLLERGAGTVVVSLGAGGLLRVGAGTPTRARLAEALTGNTTGAGDAAVAALAVGLAESAAADSRFRVEDSALVRAVAWSAAAVLHPLAGSITDPAPLLAQITLSTTEEP